jgi:hypothetical protein
LLLISSLISEALSCMVRNSYLACPVYPVSHTANRVVAKGVAS